MASPSYDLSPLWSKLDATFGQGSPTDLLQATLKSINQKMQTAAAFPASSNLRRNDALDEAMGLAPAQPASQPGGVPQTQANLGPLFNQFVAAFSSIGDKLSSFAGGTAKPPGNAGVGGGASAAATGTLGPNCCDDLMRILGSIDNHIEVLIYEARVAKSFQWGGGGGGTGMEGPAPAPSEEHNGRDDVNKKPVQMGDYWKSRKKGFWGGATALANEAGLGINRLMNPSGMVERGEEVQERGKYMRANGERGGALTEFGGRASQAGGHMIKGVGEGTTAGLAKGALGAVGALGGMIPVVGPVIKGLTTIGSGLIEAAQKLNKWSDNIHESNMKFAEFSGAMSTVQSESQIREIKMNKIVGDATAESARELAEAKDRSRKAGLAWEVRGQKINNWLAKTWREMTETGNKWIEALTPGNPLEPEDKDNLDAYDWMAQELRKNWSEVHGLPNRFKDGGGAWGG